MQTATSPRLLDTSYVQFFLDNLPPMQKFTVIFEKVDGTQRKITGYLDPNAPSSRKSAPPVITEDGWKSFKLDSVLFIDTVDNNTLNNDW